MDNLNKLLVFGLNDSQERAVVVAKQLSNMLGSPDTPGRFLGIHTEKHFEGGESYLKSNDNVRGADVYVVASLFSSKAHSVNEKLVDLLWFIGSLKDASANKITAVIPFMGYARQDRKTESRAPITTKYMAQVLEAVGVNRVLTIDVHSMSAFQNSFRIPVDNLDATRLFVDHLTGWRSFRAPQEQIVNKEFLDLDLAVVTPDHGGIGRCDLFKRALSKRIAQITKQSPKEIPLAIFDKIRVNGQVQGSQIIGDVKNKHVIIYDDLIASGSTIVKSVDAVLAAGGKVYAVCASHGQFTEPPTIAKLLGVDRASWRSPDPAFDTPSKCGRLIVTNSINQNDNYDGRLSVIDTSSFLAEAIKITHFGGSISDLLTP